MIPHTIAVIGPKGCGKSTLAASLSLRSGYLRASFAGPLKQMLRTLLETQSVDSEIIERMLYGDLKEVKTDYLGGATPRWAMQTLGTEWRDLISRELWSTIWFNAVQATTRNIVVDDMRFIHEAKVVRQRGPSLIIALTRHGFGPGEHQSEREYLDIPCDVEISNNGSVDELFARVADRLS